MLGHKYTLLELAVA